MATLNVMVERLSKDIEGNSGLSPNAKAAGDMITSQIKGWFEDIKQMKENGKDLAESNKHGEWMGLAEKKTTAAAKAVMMTEHAYIQAEKQLVKDIEKAKKDLPSKGEKAVRKFLKDKGYALDPKVPDLGQALAKRANWQVATQFPKVYNAQKEVRKAVRGVSAGIMKMKAASIRWGKENSTTGTISGALKSIAKKAIIDVQNAADTVITEAKNVLTVMKNDHFFATFMPNNLKEAFVPTAVAPTRILTPTTIFEKGKLAVRKALRENKYTSKKVVNGKVRYFYD